MAAAILYVCTTCRRASEPDSVGIRPGFLLHQAIAAEAAPEGVTVVATECLSACKTGCAVALTSSGKYSYVYGYLDPELHVTDILDGAARYAASVDGIVPWRERPTIFRKQSIARIPPL